ncbi:MAG: arginine--tRNA ligase [Actinomycetota bacterium]|nr:arginine--tRNA ligase [Actinomycetota bacterium]
MFASVENSLRQALKALGMEPPERIEVGAPREEAWGDLSTPIAMSLAKQLKKPPREIAQAIAAKLTEAGGAAFEKVEIAGPGFINVTFSGDFIVEKLGRILSQGQAFLRADIGKGKTVQVEFVSANPTGPLHLGHGRGAAVGAALSNLLAAAGFRVTKEYYVNDAGRQVALLGESVFARYQELCEADYPFPDDGYRGDYIMDIARQITEAEGDKHKGQDFAQAGNYFTEKSCAMMLAAIKKDLEGFGVAFDIWQSEKELYKKREGGESEVDDTINSLRAKGFVYDSEGAVWFKATLFGDEKDRVLKKGGGQYTYFASDIAYHKLKVDAGYDELIDIWGADHHGYIPRVKAALEALGYNREKLRVLLVQIVNLLRGGKPVQMSKRAGEFVTLKEVIDEVGADTTKFIFLTRRPDSHLDFDLETAKAASAENPVYYVQYAFARINSIFRHAREKGIPEGEARTGQADLRLLSEPEELKLAKKLLAYPTVFEGAARAHEPHRITYYLQELAGLFHPYYNRHKVVTDDTGLTLARLALVEAISTVLKDGLSILGVSAPERM